MPVVLTPKITEAGEAAALNASNNGFELELTHISFGTGASYTPTGLETALVAQEVLLPIAAGSRIKPNQIRLSTLWQDDTGTYPITEIGFWAGPTLFAVWSSETISPLAVKTAGVDFVFFYDLAIKGLPANTVTVLIDSMYNQFMTALGIHLNDQEAHPYYLRTEDFAKEQRLIWCGVAGGTANAVTLSLPAGQLLPAYESGVTLRFKASTINSGPMTVKVGALATKPLLKGGGVPVEPGDIPADSLCQITYDGSNFYVSGSISGNGQSMIIGQFTGPGPHDIEYAVGNLQVSINGGSASPADYIATDGLTVTIPDADVDDEILVFAFGSFSVANTYTKGEVDALIEAIETYLTDTYTKSEVDAIAEGLSGDIVAATLPKLSFPVKLGGTLSVGGTSSAPSMAALNSRDIAVYTETAGLSTYRFDGLAWVKVGSSLFPTDTPPVANITALNGTDIAMFSAAPGRLTTYRFNGSSWSKIGSSLDIGSSIGAVRCAALNSTDIAAVHTLTNQIRTYRFNGASWSEFGVPYISLFGGLDYITALSATDVAVLDPVNEVIIRFRFNGSVWSGIGGYGSTAGLSIKAITSLNENDVCVHSFSKKLIIYSFSGGSWIRQLIDSADVTVSAEYFSSVVALSGTDIVFVSADTRQLQAYRYGYALSRPYRPA